MKDEITKVDISKVDATTGKEIEGAKLTLKDKETGEVVESWTSGKEPHRIEGLTVSKTYVQVTMLQVILNLQSLIQEKFKK